MLVYLLMEIEVVFTAYIVMKRENRVINGLELFDLILSNSIYGVLKMRFSIKHMKQLLHITGDIYEREECYFSWRQL